MTDVTLTILQEGESHPVRIVNQAGPAPYLIVCDHAGRAVPRSLGGLGVSPAEMDRHIAWDIGAEPVTTMLADMLDAVAILQRYSRLVIDCNRAPGHPTSIAAVSDGTPVPGNTGLSGDAIAARM